MDLCGALTDYMLELFKPKCPRCVQIRVNSVNPTVVMTKMGRLGWSDPEKAKAMMSRIPLGRFAGQTQQTVYTY